MKQKIIDMLLFIASCIIIALFAAAPFLIPIALFIIAWKL